MSDPWNELSARVVMVARYAEGDGIGRYADQLIAARADDRRVLRVGIPEGPGDYHRSLHAGPRALWLLRDARRGDDIVVHWHPHYYVRSGTGARLASTLSWGVLATLRRLTVVVHEPDPATGPWLEERARRWSWRRAGRLVFHSEWERRRHAERFGSGRRQEQLVVAHGDFFSSTITAGRAEARERLGLPAARTVLVMIGFISPRDPDKGYDRAIAAVRAAGGDAELHIVGSPIRDDAEVERLLGELRAHAAAGDGVHLHEQYVSDEDFDLWVRAADAVLTPYRTSSSSGVIARARLLGTPVITSDAGGLAEQAGPRDTVVRDDDELVRAVQRASRSR